MNKYVEYIFSILKTVYFNFRVFNFKKAIKLPVFISYKMKILQINKNSIEILDKIKTGMIKIGFGGTDVISSQKGKIKIEKDCKLYFEGKAYLAAGTIICCENNSSIRFGRNFASNKNNFFYSRKEIVFGDDNLIGWNVIFRDNDGHKIFYKEIQKENEKKICIGNHVWIASYVDVLKGVTIPNDCIIATRSCVTKEFKKEKILIGGYPAKIITSEIEWEK